MTDTGVILVKEEDAIKNLLGLLKHVSTNPNAIVPTNPIVGLNELMTRIPKRLRFKESYSICFNNVLHAII